MTDFYVNAADVPVSAARPLLIADIDEVVLLFADGFDKFLAARDLFLDFRSYYLLGNVRRQKDRSTLCDDETEALLEEFRSGFDSLRPVDGVVEAMRTLPALLDVVLLSNMASGHVPARNRNLARHGLTAPLMINSGLKGAAVKALAARAGGPIFFVDDIPRHLASVAKEAGDVFRIHLVGDRRYDNVRPVSHDAHLSVGDWTGVARFIRDRCNT